MTASLPFVQRLLLCPQAAFRRAYSKSNADATERLLKIIESMPKVPTAAIQLRAQRINAKAKNANKPKPRPSEISLWVLGNGGPANPQSLYVSTDQGRYLFNCGEGTQRLATEHKMKLSKLEHLFFTHNKWKNIGGLPGLALTVQDIGVPEFFVHGPANMEQLFEMTKGFMMLQNITITKRNPSDKVFSDNCMEVVYVPLFLDEAVDSSQTDENGAKRPRRCSQDDPDSAPVVAYICKPHSRPGQLNLEKCVSFGVPPGPLLGELKSGRDVTLPDGTVVKSRDVVSPEEAGPVFIVVEVPSEDYLQSLLEAEPFKSHQVTASREEHAAKVVVHFTPSSVMRHPLYMEWIKRFPASTTHLVLNECASSLSSIALHRAQHRLHLLSSSIFPLLHIEESSGLPKELAELNCIVGETLLRYKLRPLYGLQRDSVVCVDPEAYVEEAHCSCYGFTKKLEELKAAAASKKDEAAGKPSHPEILFLGTASAVPGKDRNVSAILINVSEDMTVLFDCGEGTFNQLVRFYGLERARHVLTRLSCVFVSHLHADHHLGLVKVLKGRQSAFEILGIPYEPLLVVAPRFMVPWMSRCSRAFDSVAELFRYVDNASLLYDQESPSPEKMELLQKLKLKDFSTVLVLHCKNAYGVTITAETGWKLTYSGDTMPCDALIEAGKGSDILIHEATMEDDLAEEAVIKTHSTTSQAIEVGERMGAKFTLLTHFSQRYAKLPLISDKFHSTVGCAFDHMLVRPSDLPVLPLLFPALKSLFAEHYEEMQEKTAKKLRQKALLNASTNSSEIKLQTSA
ncbi:ribonuclease Z, mitochondrial [Rhipicephalus sanguineus]|nr:ribonuclease Z, mitochondrial [Rhipicephalus sanguineus]